MSQLYVYVAAANFIPNLCQELGTVQQVIENLVISPVYNPNVVFAEDIWMDAQIATIPSISKAAQMLKQAGKYWYLHPVSHVRRSRLIEGELKKLPDLNRSFPLDEPIAPIGVFSLLDANTLLFTSKRWKAWPLGECFFQEDKINPPNRAYLKLWEALTLFGTYPKPNETALDLGASPGGWTQVLQRFGVKVTAVDKADLAPRIASLPNVTHLKQSAFALEPEKWPTKIDWLVCDIACYPNRLFPYILRWIQSEKVKRMIVTIKLQGEEDLAAIAPFLEMNDSRVTHLFYNKHEVTFLHCREGLGGFIVT